MKSLRKKLRILISRTDSLGDLILTLPLGGVLYHHLEGKVEIAFLIRKDLFPILSLCSYRPRGIAYPPEDLHAFREELSGFDVLIHVFPRPRVAWEGFRAGIPIRIGTAYRFYHWITCNRLLPLRRRGSRRHEAELNLQLLKPLGIVPPPLSELPRYFYLPPSPPPLSKKFASLLDPHRFRLVLHPFTRGNTMEWPPSHFYRLISLLPQDRYQIILTGSREERERWRKAAGTPPREVLDLMGETTLDDLIGLIARVDGVVANSTGPLHLSAFLGKRVLGLYPPCEGIGPERWRPIGVRAEYIVSSPCSCENSARLSCECMAKISPEMVAERILRWGDPDPHGDESSLFLFNARSSL